MIKAVIIDDELRARRVLSSSIMECTSSIDIVAEAADVPSGVLAINKYKPDVVFLDIEMPDYSGFELLSFFREIDFEIVFVTAYNQYAIQAFEVSAIDYLLKPIRIDLLEKAILKLEQKIHNSQINDRLDVLKTNLQHHKIEKITIPVSDGLIFVKVSDISYIEADGSYAHLHQENGSKMMISKNLKYFENALEESDQFYRVHRSFLVNVANIYKYNRHDSLILLENGTKIKVAREIKTKFEQSLKNIHA